MSDDDVLEKFCMKAEEDTQDQLRKSEIRRNPQPLRNSTVSENSDSTFNAIGRNDAKKGNDAN